MKYKSQRKMAEEFFLKIEQHFISYENGEKAVR